MNTMKKISFDFDGTLSRKDIHAFAKEMALAGHEVWIVTSRFGDEEGLAKNWNWIPGQNEKVFAAAEDIGIPKERIVFTNMAPKIDFLKGKGFALHLDDDDIELMDIFSSKDACSAINANHSDWEYFCREEIEKTL